MRKKSISQKIIDDAVKSGKMSIMLVDNNGTMVGFALSDTVDDDDVAAEVYTMEGRLVATVPRKETTIGQLIEILVKDRVSRYVA